LSLLDEARKKLFRDKGIEVGNGKTESKPGGKIEHIDEQSPDERELAGWLKNKLEEIRGSANRITHEGIWMTNIAYALGFDSVYYDPNTKAFKPTDRSINYLRRNRIHENLILPAAQNRLARLCKIPPRFDVKPNSPDEDDREAARLGMEVILGVWDKQKVDHKRLENGMWLQECGSAFMGVSWDPTLGDELYDDDTGECVGYEGDIRVDVVPAFEFFPDPLANSMDDLRFCFRAKVRKLEYFRNQYPDRGHLVQSENVWLLSQQYQLRINSLNNVGPTSSSIQQQSEHTATEVEYCEARSLKYPQGRMVVMANGVILEDKPLPIGEIPYAKFDDIMVAGKFYGEACITHARPLQDQYNRVLARRSEWANKFIAGKYMAARGHALSQEALNDQSGEVVEYDLVAGTEPKPMATPTLPQYAYEESKDLKNSVFEVFGLSEVSRGQLPSAGIPAVGMQLLLEQDETRVGIETEQHEHAFADIGRFILKHAGRMYKTERKLKTKGKNLEYQIKLFTGDDLCHNYDVSVVRGSMVPTSKYLKRQEILNAMNLGLLGDPHDPAVRERVLGELEFGDIAEIYKDRHLDMAQIKISIQMIEQGFPPEIHEADNHVLYIQELNRYRKSEKYEKLDPLNKVLFEAVFKQHQISQAMLQNPQLAQPPEPPPPPPPITSLPGMPPPQGGPPMPINPMAINAVAESPPPPQTMPMHA
jgi:hypothetical protein